MPKKYQVFLAEEERQHLHQLLASGTAPTRTLTHARILLKADESDTGPAWTDTMIAAALEVCPLTVTRVRQRFAALRLEGALHRRKPEKTKGSKLDGAQEAHLIALTCSTPPEGQDRWTLRLLAEKFVELGHVESLSYETVRQVLKRGSSNLGSGSVGASRPSKTGLS